MTYFYTKIWKTAVLSLSLGLTVLSASAQMKFGGNNESRGDAILELSHTKKGLLLPRINATALSASPLDTAAPGMIVYNLTDNTLYVRKKTGPTTNAWITLLDGSASAGNAWSFTGNNNINPATNFLGSTNAQPLVFKTNNVEAARILSTGRVGIGTATPNAKLHVNGSMSTNLAISTGNYAMADSTSVVIMNNTTDATFTLQAAANQNGRAVEIIAYNTGTVNFAGGSIRTQGGANPTVALIPGYSLRLVSNGTDWVVTGKQRSGMPMYLATTAGTGEGEVIRDYNGYLNNGSSVIQTDVAAAPLNPIPNETAWFSMMLQAVGSTYYGQFNLNDHNAYFRGGEKTNVATNTWYKFLSHPARINFGVQEIGNGGIYFNNQENEPVAFGTNNLQRVAIAGDGVFTVRTGGANNTRMNISADGVTNFQTQMQYNVVNPTGNNYTVVATDYTIVMNSNSNMTVNLPDASSCIGRVLVIKKLYATNNRQLILSPTTSDKVDAGTAGADWSSGANNTLRSVMIQASGNDQWIIISQF